MKRLAALAIFAVALAVAPVAAGDGFGPFAQQGGLGVLTRPNGTGSPLRFVAIGLSSNADTLLEAIDPRSGQVIRWTDIAGSWGIPAIVYNEPSDALARDGRTLVLSDASTNLSNHFLVYDLRALRLKQSIVLNGNWAFDALSPDASRLYLIQYVSGDLSHYIVRAYDLKRGRLLPGRIADRTQKSWVMNGYPLSRTVSQDGRWVYTLYQNAGNGYPFIHALDTVRGVAHCVGLPLTTGLYNTQLTLHGGTLAVHWRSGRPWLNLNTSTWRLSPAREGFPWQWIALGLGGALALAIGAGALRRRRGSENLERELADLLCLPEREPVA